MEGRGFPKAGRAALRDFLRAKTEGNPSVLGLLKCTDGSVLALLKSIDSSVLALLRLPSIFSHQNFTVGEFWCTMAIMQEKQQNFIFEIERWYCKKPEVKGNKWYCSSWVEFGTDIFRYLQISRRLEIFKSLNTSSLDTTSLDTTT